MPSAWMMGTMILVATISSMMASQTPYRPRRKGSRPMPKMAIMKKYVTSAFGLGLRPDNNETGPAANFPPALRPTLFRIVNN